MSDSTRVVSSEVQDPWDWADQFAWDFEKHYGWVGRKLRIALAAEIRKQFNPRDAQ